MVFSSVEIDHTFFFQGTDATTAFDNIAQLNKLNSEISTKSTIETFNIPMSDGQQF